MTGPPLDPVADYLNAKKQAVSDPVADYLKAKGAPAGDGNKFHARYASGELQKHNAAASKRDAQNLADEEATPKSNPFLASLAATGANIAQGIPGAERAQAAIGSAASRLPGMGGKLDYQQSLKSLREQTGKIPAALRIPEKMVGGLATLPFLPANPAMAGALLGGADQALGADEMSGGGRIARTVGGAAVGGVLGHVGGKMATGLKAKFTPTPQDNIIARQAERAASAKRLFDGAKSESEFKKMTPQIKAYLAEPEIAQRVEALQQLDQFKNVPAESYDMLDALHKSLSDEAHMIGKGMAQVDPSKPNTGRFRAENVRSLKDRLVGLMEAPGKKVIPAPETAQSPNPTMREALSNFDKVKGIAVGRREGTVEQQMARKALERHHAEQIVQPPLRGAPQETVVETNPLSRGYREANQDFAQRSSEIEAVGKGMNAMQGKTRPSFKQIMSKDAKTPETFAQWAKGQQRTPGELKAAREGVLGDVRNAFSEPGWRMKSGRDAAGKAEKILRGMDPSETDAILKLLASISGATR